MSGTSSNTANDASVYIFLGVLILLVLRRFARVIRGSRISRGRTIAFAVYYLAFAALLIAVSVLSGGVSPDYLALYVLVAVAGAYGSYVFSNNRLAFWKGADGSVYYKGAILVYVVYLVGLITRIAIDLALIGPQAFTFSPGAATPTLSATAIDAGIVTDVLLALGSGLLTGRNIRVMKRYDLIVAGKEQVPDTPPKVPLL